MKIKFWIIISGFLLLPAIGRASLLIDDFNDAAKPNALAGDSGTTTSGSGNDEISFYNVLPTNIYGQDGYSLKLEWAAANNGDWAGYWTKLSSANTGIDVSSYKYLSFRVKGEAGGEFFKIQLLNASTDTARNNAHLYIADYLDGGVTTEWRKVNIPLDAFVNLDSLANVTELNFVFEATQSIQNGSPTSGVIYFDDFIFGDWFGGVTRLDHYSARFGTSTSINALGGNMGDLDSNPPALVHSISTNVYRNYANALYSPYDVTVGYAGIFSVFGGGTNGFTAISHNISAYDTLVFWAKAKSNTENPGSIKIELADSVITSSYVVSGLTASWQEFSLPLSSFTPTLDKSNIKQMNIIYEDWRATNKIGAVYFDEFDFQGAPYGVDASSPAMPTNLKDNGVLIITGHIFDTTNVLTCNADTLGSDNSLEGVRFEYLLNAGTSWHIIATDYDTANSTYTATWNTGILSAGTTVYLRAISQDAVGNEAAMTVIQGIIPFPPDTTLPSPVTDLTAIAGNGQVTLTWTAPGDDGDTGTATRYILKYSFAGISTDVDFNNAANISNSLVPKVAGSQETFVVTGLTNGTTYYFAIKSEDAAGNVSVLSNSPKATPFATIIPLTPEESLNKLVVYPNPYRPNSGSGRSGIIFAKLTRQAKIEIFTLSGEKIRELNKDDATDAYTWDVRNGDGDQLSSGIYLFIVTDVNGNQKSGKIAVVK